MGKRSENLLPAPRAGVSNREIALASRACFGLTESLSWPSGCRDPFVFTLFFFSNVLSRVSGEKMEKKIKPKKKPPNHPPNNQAAFKCQTEFSIFLSHLRPILLFTFKVYFWRLLRCFGVFLWGNQIETDQYLLSLKGLLKRQLTTNCLAALPSLISGSPKVQAEMNSVMGHFKISPSA